MMDQSSAIPKVSVCVVTYNQEDYIRQCLDSILAQETNFLFEIIIGDDCSTDGTKAIIEEYLDHFPGKIFTHFHEKNCGPTRNYDSVHRVARGELIAHIDGDDYMLPGKLQAQVDALEAHPECSLCFHAVERFDPIENRCISFRQKIHPAITDIAYLLMNLGYFIHSSKMYRACCRKNFDIGSQERLDCYLHVHHALHGKILYLPQVLGGYRLNSGISMDRRDKRKTRYRQPAPEMFDKVMDTLNYARHCGVPEDVVTRAEGNLYFAHAYSILMAGDLAGFKIAIRKSAEISRMTPTQRLFWFFSGAPWILFLLVRVRDIFKQVLARW